MIIFDLDGTLADCEHRRHFVNGKNIKNLNISNSYALTVMVEGPQSYYNPEQLEKFKPDWKSFYESCDKDDPIHPVIEIYKQLNWESEERSGSVEIWSGRCESVREKTEEWLWKYCGCGFHPDISHYNILKMRPLGDSTPDDLLKEKWLDEAISQGKTIEFVFDDRKKVVEMWRRRGIFVFDVSQGKGDF